MSEIAYFDASHDLPEEIVMAAGMTPIKILGDVNNPNDLADQYLPQFFCPQARSFLTEALQSPNKWAGIIIQLTDAMRLTDNSISGKCMLKHHSSIGLIIR